MLRCSLLGLYSIALVFCACANADTSGDYPFDNGEWYQNLDATPVNVTKLDSLYRGGDFFALFGTMRQVPSPNRDIVDWFRRQIAKDEAALMIHYASYIYQANLEEAGLYWSLGILYGYEDTILCADETAHGAIAVMMMNAQRVAAALTSQPEIYFKQATRAKELAKEKRNYSGWPCSHGLGTNELVEPSERPERLIIARKKANRKYKPPLFEQPIHSNR